MTPDLKKFAHEPVIRSNFIEYHCEHFPTDQLHDIHTEVQDIFQANNTKYIWLSEHRSVYKFGKMALKSRQILQSEHITECMYSLNKKFGLHFDSCLLSCYTKPSDSISRHQDNELLIDQAHSICNLSLGSSREIEFWDSHKEGSGNLIHHIFMQEGSLVFMLPGCQQRLWHNVRKGEAGTRYCLSFRKYNTPKPQMTTNIRAPCSPIAHSTPASSRVKTMGINKNTGYQNTGYQDLQSISDHKSLADITHCPLISALPTPPPITSPIPLPTIPADPPTTPHTPTPTTPTPLTPPPPTPPPTAPPDPPATPHTPPTPPTPNPPTPPPRYPPSTNTPPPEPISSHLPPPTQMPKDHQNVIIGDSLVKGLNVKNSIHICQGGIHPNQVLQLLPTSSDVLPPECYNEVKTLTLIVGTNALNVTDNILPIPLLEVIKDYEKLIYELRSLFPNARIGLFNIIPRAYSCRETYHRIDVFNSLLSGHVANIIPNVYWIRLYWEFVDKSGYLRHEFYGRNGVHLNFRGKGFMARTISNFQRSYF